MKIMLKKNRKYSKSFYYSNKNIKRNFNLNNKYLFRSNKDKNKNNENELENENIIKDQEEDVEANDKNPLKQMKKLRHDKIKEESLLNNDKGLSFKRLSINSLLCVAG